SNPGHTRSGTEIHDSPPLHQPWIVENMSGQRLTTTPAERPIRRLRHQSPIGRFINGILRIVVRHQIEVEFRHQRKLAGNDGHAIKNMGDLYFCHGWPTRKSGTLLCVRNHAAATVAAHAAPAPRSAYMQISIRLPFSALSDDG